MKNYCLYLEEFNSYFEFALPDVDDKNFLIDLHLTKYQWEYDPNIKEYEKELSQKTVEELLSTPPIYEINEISTLPDDEHPQSYITDSVEYQFNKDTNKIDKKRIWKLSPLFSSNNEIEDIKYNKISDICFVANRKRHENFPFKLSNGKQVTIDCSPEHIKIYNADVPVPQFGKPSSVVSVDIFVCNEDNLCKNISVSTEDFCKIQMYIKNRNKFIEAKETALADIIKNCQCISDILNVDWEFDIYQYKITKQIENQYTFLKNKYYTS